MRVNKKAELNLIGKNVDKSSKIIKNLIFLFMDHNFVLSMCFGH